MARKKTKSFDYNKLIWPAVAVVLLTGLVLRLYDLNMDPPLYFDGHGQSLSTDPYQYTYFARNKILYGQWELFDSARWKVFEFSLISGLSYVLFLLFGISRYAANLSGVIPTYLAVILFLAALKKYINPRGILIASIFLIFNEAIHVYSRVPYLENGMLFLAASLFFVFVYYRHLLWGKIVLGVLVALAALSGKVFGYVLIIPLVASLWFENKEDRRQTIGIVVGSCLTFSLVWVLIIHGTDFNQFFGYFRTQTIGLYGFPKALKSPLAFFERLISFGGESRFYSHAPALAVSGFVAVLLLVLNFSRDRLRESLPLFFILIWFIAGQLFFMTPNYRPPRYMFMLYFPLAGLVGFAFSDKRKASNSGKSYFRFILMFFLLWIFVMQMIYNLFYDGEFDAYYQKLVWISAPIALIVVIFQGKSGFLRFLNNKHFKSITIVAMLFLAVFWFGKSFVKWQKYKSYNITEAGQDIGQIINENAVICGPIAPTLLPENKIKGMIYAVGISDLDSDFFHKYPVTHFAIDASASGTIIKKFPELENVIRVSDYWIRDDKVMLVRISDLTGNPKAGTYRPSGFEIGQDFLDKRQLDSAIYYLEKFIAVYPENKSCLKMLGEAYSISGKIDIGLETLRKAVKLYPRDFTTHFMLAAYYQHMAMLSGDNSYKNLARNSYEKVTAVNPYQGDEVTAMVEKIAGRK